MNRTVYRSLLLNLLFAMGAVAHGQGDNHFQSNFFGDQYLLNTAPPLFPFPPRSVNIGDGTTFNLASLNVRGDQLPVPDGLAPPLQPAVLNTFRTDVASARAQSWHMKRNVLDIGAIWNESEQLAFHIQSLEARDDGQDRYSGLMLHNEPRSLEWRGLWIMNEGPPTGGRAFPNPTLQLLDAKGYAGLGYIETMRAPGSANPRGPWSRFHLFHNVMSPKHALA